MPGHEGKAGVVRHLVTDARPRTDTAEAFAPSNIALCKYWGKRDAELNLPVNASLSVGLRTLGSRTRLTPLDANAHQVFLDDEPQAADSPFSQRLRNFLALFEPLGLPSVRIETWNSVPTAAGLASSASGFAALVRALDQLCGWQLDAAALSVLARLGSGSACRSLHDGFVEWRMGVREDGMDSCAAPRPECWPELRVGLLKLCSAPKRVGSRAGMKRTLETSHLYQSWPRQAGMDLARMHDAIEAGDFPELGATAEQNALAMHATMIAAWPPLLYWQPQSLAAMERVWALRDQGLALYFTLDAGPNLKLLFEARDQKPVLAAFADLEVVEPFAGGH